MMDHYKYAVLKIPQRETVILYRPHKLFYNRSVALRLRPPPRIKPRLTFTLFFMELVFSALLSSSVFCDELGSFSDENRR